MLIACLAWGSVVWDARELPRRGPWFADGPLVPVEFARVADDGCLTPVLVPGVPLVRSYWGLLDLANLAEAIAALGMREGLQARNFSRHIGVWNSTDPYAGDAFSQRLAAWAAPLGLDALVWSNLPPRFAGEDGRIPSPWEAVHYLQGLQGEERQRAERYVRLAPRQIDTETRRYIELKLGWTPMAHGDW